MRKNEQSIDAVTIQRKRKMINWSVFQVIVPYFFVVICWPVASIAGVHYAFEKTFFGADLVLLGVMLFIALVVEMHIEDVHPSDSTTTGKLDWYWTCTLFFLIVFLLAFVIIKQQTVGYDFPSVKSDAPQQQLSPLVTECIYASLIAGLLGFVWSMIAGIHTNKIYLKAEIEARKRNVH